MNLHASCRDALTFAVDTQHHLNGLLEALLGEDGARFLSNKFRMKVRENVNAFEIERRRCKQIVIDTTTSLRKCDVDESLTEPEP